MPTTTHKAEPALVRDPINPKTGRAWTLADPEISAELDRDLQDMKRHPEKAKRLLQEVGILNKKGKLARRYGG